MPIVPLAPNTGVFKIDEVLHGPPVLNGFTGKEITVMFSESPAARWRCGHSLCHELAIRGEHRRNRNRENGTQGAREYAQRDP